MLKVIKTGLLLGVLWSIAGMIMIVQPIGDGILVCLVAVGVTAAMLITNR